MSIAHTGYYRAELPWTISRDDERRFRKILLAILLLFLVLSVVLPLLPVKDQARKQAVAVPPRLARIIEEKRRLPPQEQAKPPKTQDKTSPKQKKVTKKKQTVERPSARKKAASAGLLAFADELADLREYASVAQLAKASLSKAGSRSRKTTRSMITSGVTRGSGGINTASLSRDTGGSGLGGRQTTRVKSPVGSAGGGRAGGGKGRAVSRDLEKIQVTFDRNKGAIYSIYNRALRKDPTLQGKVVLSLTIAPSGKVLACKIVSSELGDSRLERKLVQRVKMIRFGPEAVGPFTFTYPIDFFPA
jgi:TonB family protein